jgi:hypothetical protein
MSVVLLFAISCKKDHSAKNNANVSTDVAADMAASAVAANSFGFVSMADNISANAQANSLANGQSVNSTSPNAVHQACGTTITDSSSFSGNTNSVTFDAFYKFSRTLNCSNNNPDNIIITLTYHGSFDGPRLSSSASGTSSVTIGGLNSSATNFIINGSYNRKGSFNSKVGNKTSGNSVIDINASNVTLSKSSRVITGGTANIVISGTVPAGTFSFSGTLVFNGDNQATLTVGTSVYIINLLTGTHTKK